MSKNTTFHNLWHEASLSPVESAGTQVLSVISAFENRRWNKDHSHWVQPLRLVFIFGKTLTSYFH